METFFTSDTHAWHRNIIAYCRRPFADEMVMTQTIAANINRVVQPNDTLYHLGDWGMGTPAMLTHFREMLDCKHIVLILGNHDKRIRDDKNLQKLFDKCYGLEGGRRSFSGYHVKVDGQDITMCHYAMRVWNGSHFGGWHLYGHSHGTLPDDPHSLSLDVGVDCWNMTPVSMDELNAAMQRKEWKPIDHHTGEYGVE